MHKRSLNNRLMDCAKVLLAVSIVLLISGIVLDIRERERILLPLEISDPEEENFISIDSTGSSSYIHSGGSQVQNNIAPIDTTLNLDETNRLLRTEIESTYGISVHYGNETRGYVISSSGKTITTEPISDSTIAYNQLTRLKNTLALYPHNLFKEIEEGGIPLTVYLIQKYSDDSITGITDSNYNYANISIASMYSFEESFYHESYHYIERYLLKKGADLTDWNELNPTDFSYGTILDDYSYSNTFTEESYFVNNYAQTSSEEDRASTFEYMMASNKARCLNNGKPIWKKALKIASTIEAIMNSVTTNVTEHWEQFL